VRTGSSTPTDRRSGSGRQDDPEGPTWTVLGRRIGVPVEVRTARQWTVQYLVPAGAAQRLIAPSGLEVTGPVPGRALMALAVCRYLDTDLDPYHEVAMSFVVRRHDAAPGPSAFRRVGEFARGDLGAYIHRLPVDQAFTCAAGRDIWGFPKWVATIDVDEPAAGDRHRGVTARLVDADRHVLSLSVFGGGRLALPSQAPPTYSYDGRVLRRTSWSTTTTGVTGRPGGARLVLGDHPMADELRSLGLPKRALFSSSARQMSAAFGAPEVVATPDH
jgi:Acetoacetate decarboxylase (ADC)